MARRNNSERTGAPHPDAHAPIEASSTADIFSFVTPTEFVDLPSEGRYYPEGNPLHGAETLEIRHMTAKEEDILTSEALLKKGLAIDRLVESVIVDKRVKIRDLLVGDKNALIIAARITGFGPLYDSSVTCPECSAAAETTFDLSKLPIIRADELPDTVSYENDEFCFTLPTTGVNLGVKLLTVADEHTLTQINEKKKKLRQPSARSTTLLKLIITSVGGHTDKESIDKFIEMMPLPDVQYLRTVYEKIKPDIDVECEFFCEECEYVGKVVMPLTAAFFWPRR